MPASKIRTDYAALSDIAKQFGQQAEANRQMLQQLQQQMEVLRSGHWVGKGADKFYAEMDSALLPSVNRLVATLDSAARVTQQVSNVMKQAEDDSARVLRGEGDGDKEKLGGIIGGVIGGIVGTVVGGPIGGIAGAVAGAAAGEAIESATGSGSGGASDPRVDAVQKKIDAGDKQGAIDESIKQYGIDTSNVNGKPTYNSSTSGEGATKPDRTVSIGDDAFSSPGWLASSVGHEALHATQQAEGRWYTDANGDAMNEVEAYDWEIKNASKNGLTQAEINTLKSRRQAYYNTMNDAYKRQVDSGKYTRP